MGGAIKDYDILYRKRTRDAHIWDLHKNQGLTCQETADAVGVSLRTVNRAIADLKDSFFKNNAVLVSAWHQTILENEYRIQAEAWAAWEKSKEPILSTVEGEDRGKGTSLTTTTHSNGDTAYLRIIQASHDRVAKILGLYAPTKHAVANVNIDMTKWPDHMLVQVENGREPLDVALEYINELPVNGNGDPIASQAIIEQN